MAQRTLLDTGADVLRGIFAGMLAGAAASWMMNQFQQMQPAQSGGSGGGPSEPTEPRRASGPETQGQSTEEESATVKTAQLISRRLFDHDLSPEEQQWAGPAVHYAYGTLMGGLYGGLAEVLPAVGAGMGIPYGTLLWIAGDEIAMPAMGIGKKPTEVALETHADAFATHLCYGITTDLLRRILRHVL